MDFAICPTHYAVIVEDPARDIMLSGAGNHIVGGAGILGEARALVAAAGPGSADVNRQSSAAADCAAVFVQIAEVEVFAGGVGEVTAIDGNLARAGELAAVDG